MKRRISLRQELLVALVVPAAVVLSVLAWFAVDRARRALDQALGERLLAVAQAAGPLVGPRIVALEAGDDDTRTKKNALAKLESLRAATNSARIVVGLIDDGAALLDTKEELKVGDPYTRARFDRHELSRVKEKQTAATVLFDGPDGKAYKSGYAPLYDEDGGVVAFVVVEAPASYEDALDALKTSLVVVVLLALLLLLLVAVIIARQVSVPLSALSAAAERIGRGELGTVVPTDGPREAAVLGETMGQMAASLKARDEELQLMLAGIAHEVRNPLGGIELFGGLLREDLEAGDPRRKHVDKILRELQVLAKVVNDFLDYARKKELDRRESGIRDLCEEVLAVAKKDAQDKGVDLELEVASELAAPIDPDTMKRALLNLVRNAIQAAPAQGGKVRIQARCFERTLEVVVEDNGPGVPADKRPEIWRPFFTTKQKGTGLGLALVKKTVLGHQGHIEVEDRPGGGARFVITLPVELEPAGDAERPGH